MSSSLYVPVELDVLLVNNALSAAPKSGGTNTNFLQWKFQYQNLAGSSGNGSFSSPEPKGGTVAEAGVDMGAYLHWELPRSLRTSSTGNVHDAPLVPNRWLVVRVSRTASLTVSTINSISGSNVLKAWVVEGDCPNNSGAGSDFVVDGSVVTAWSGSPESNRKAATPTEVDTTKGYLQQVGVAFEANSWTENAADLSGFLTAVSPGNVAFSAYYPHNENIFSFYDDLSDAPTEASLSYFVTGWYANNNEDILTVSGKAIADVLSALNWKVAGNQPSGAPGLSLYTGMAFNLAWNKDDTSPNSPDQLDAVNNAADIKLSIANTSIDAFTSLVADQLTNTAGYAKTNNISSDTIISLFRAFQYDFLDKLNQPNGEALLAEKNVSQWFSSKYGGTRWVVVNAQADQGGTLKYSDVPHPAWLVTLNENQAKLDAALSNLYSLQWDLNAAWWKLGFFNTNLNPFGNDTGYSDNTTLKANLATATSNVVAQLAKVAKYLALVPTPMADTTKTAQENYQAGVEAFATSNSIGSGLALKAITQPRYWMSNNPNIVVSGIEPASISNPNSNLTVRIDSQVLTAFTDGTTNIDASALTSLTGLLTNSGAFPAGVASMFAEFTLLDPANAGQIATATGADETTLSAFMNGQMTTPTPGSYTGTLPINSMSLWSQGWKPLYLEWEVSYQPIPYQYNGTYNWQFNGTDYELSGNMTSGMISDIKTDAKIPPSSTSGRSLLSPHLAATFGTRLNTFLNEFGGDAPDDAILEALYDEIKSIDNWKYLSQELIGFNDLLTGRSPLLFRRPVNEAPSSPSGVSYAELIGYVGTTPAASYITPEYAQGLVGSVPDVSMTSTQVNSSIPFHAIRSGQAYFTKVVFYDKFGRLLKLIGGDGLSSDTSYLAQIDKAMSGTKSTFTPNIASPFLLPPRLLQPARLNLEMVDQKDNSKVLGLDADVNPVCGWVIPNHIDKSLLIFGPTGTNLGELQLTDPSAASGATVTWLPPIDNNTVTSIATDITPNDPELGAFLTSIVSMSTAEFEQLLFTIDSTLWTTQPLGTRSDKDMTVLIGRPLALLRVQLQFVLDGNPIANCDWAPKVAGEADSKIPDFTTNNFSIRLGDMATREDGVMGYFASSSVGGTTDYSVFNSVAAPDPSVTQAYVKQIGGADANYIQLPFDGTTTEMVTLLVDPRAGIHATTGILPVTDIKIPDQFISAALEQIEITFKTGPLLTRVSKAPTSDKQSPTYTDGINFLPLAEKHGKWSWWESAVASVGADPTWTGYDLLNPGTQAELPDAPATLREGYLKFKTDLDS
ncbi:MAG: hypothetical protein HEP71_33060 [Roseivirga sp.]|nr:hypothetical protein [Roseivirga sp.]